MKWFLVVVKIVKQDKRNKDIIYIEGNDDKIFSIPSRESTRKSFALGLFIRFSNVRVLFCNPTFAIIQS